MLITATTKIKVQNTTEFAINTETGGVVVTLDTDGASKDLSVTEPSRLIVPGDTTLTFTLNGDTATITRL